jgi:predicted nucleotide-binding protein
MAKRTTNKSPKLPKSASLNKAISLFKTELKDRVEKGNDIYKKEIKDLGHFYEKQQEFSDWNDYNLEFLKQSFDDPYNEYRKKYSDAGEWSGMIVTSAFGSGETTEQKIQKFHLKFEKKLNNLKQLLNKVDLLKSEIEDDKVDVISEIVSLDTSKVFIVHGHDDIAKLETARFIEQLGFEPIILHEQASSGKTIIEKIESYSNVGFGIVLYTSCDIGAKKGEENNLNERARQNVVFEHGYLIGKIGRENVCAIVKGNIETPNDISGVVYISMSSDWKLELAKELRNSGYKVDMNLVI